MSERRPPLLPPDALGPEASSRLGGVVFLLTCFAVALWDLSGRSIYHKDLPRFATIAREMIRSGDWLVPTQYGETYANKPPLYIWAVALPSALFGDPTAFLLRLPNAVALVATACATAMWGEARSGSKSAGRAAGLMVLTTWFVTELGRVGRPDMFATAASTIAAAFLDRAVLGRGGKRDVLWAGLAMGAGILSKGPVALLLPLLVVVLPRAAIPWRERFSRGRPLAATCVALGVAALWIVPVVLRDGWPYVGRLLGQVSERVEGRGNHLEGPFYYFVQFPTAAVPWSPLYLAAAVAFCFRRVRAALGDGAHLAAAGVTLVVLSAVPTKETRYASILVPSLAVAAAQGMRFLADRASDRVRLVQALRISGSAAILLAIGAVYLHTRAPVPVVYVAAPALLFVAGFHAIRVASMDFDARALAGRIAGIALIAACVAPCVYWPYLGRYLVTKQDVENQAVLAVLDPSAPVVILGGDLVGALNSDDFFPVGARATFVRRAAATPSKEASPRLFLLCLSEQVPDVEGARGESSVEVLRRTRADGKTIVVLRFGPPRSG